MDSVVIQMLSNIQKEQAHLKERLASPQHAHELSLLRRQFRTEIIPSFQSLETRLDQIENSIGNDSELPEGSKAMGTEKPLKDRLRNLENLVLEILDKMNAGELCDITDMNLIYTLPQRRYVTEIPDQVCTNFILFIAHCSRAQINKFHQFRESFLLYHHRCLLHLFE